MQNDPAKTTRAALFIVNAVQHIKIGDMSMHQSGFSLSGDAPAEDIMETDGYEIPDGIDGTRFPVYSRAEERTLVRDSTASFSGAPFHYSLLATLTAVIIRLGHIACPTRPCTL